MIEFRLLGPLEAKSEETTINLGGPKQRAVLAYLLFRANRVCPTDDIVNAIWGGGADRSDTLHVYLAELRKAMDPNRLAKSHGLIETVRPGYRLSATSSTLDLLAFNELSEEGRRAEQAGDASEALRSWQGALSLWRGPPASDLSGFEFVDSEARALHRQRRDIATHCLEMHLAQGAPELVVAEAEPLIEEDPYDERVRSLQMLALYRLGRQREALAAYQELSQLLLDELGISPTAELQELEVRILQQDPRLLLEASLSVGATATVRADSGPHQTAELIRLDDGNRYRLDQTITTLGRLHDRDVVVDDELASRRHAEIRRTAGGFRLIDAGSTNGVLVNGERVDQIDLTAGDEVTIGDTVFEFETAD